MPPFYDPLISKLVAWGEDRRQAIARMRRALREYEVVGIRTTVPFFRWFLEQPAFVAGEFDTAFLDELLHHREGRPFSEPDPSLEEVAVIAAALLDASASTSVSVPPEVGAAGSDARRALLPQAAWKVRARHEGLRG